MRIKRKREVFQGIGVFFLIGFGGFLYQVLERLCWGIDVKNSSLLSVAIIFLILFVFWRWFILSNPDRENSSSVKKNIWKWDKGGIGLMVLLFVMGLWGMGIGVHAKEIRDKLPIVIYDETGHKVLWNDEKINALQGNFRCEIPKECFEQGKEYSIIITLEDKSNSQIMVRQFEVKTVK